MFNVGCSINLLLQFFDDIEFSVLKEDSKNTKLLNPKITLNQSRRNSIAGNLKILQNAFINVAHKSVQTN